MSKETEKDCVCVTAPSGRYICSIHGTVVVFADPRGSRTVIKG